MNLFKSIRLTAYLAVIAASAVVLGLEGNFGSLFLPHLHRPFIIFGLIVPTATIVLLTFLLLRSQPRVDLFFLFFLSVGWLTMGAWSVDMIGGIECFPLGNQTVPTKNGTMSYQTYCYEMKSIEAFSWANFVMLMLSFIILLMLVVRLTATGRYNAWEESISEIPWFGQMPVGYDNYPRGQPVFAPASSYTGQYGQQPYVIQQAPGHSVVIQPNANGMPSISQVRGDV